MILKLIWYSKAIGWQFKNTPTETVCDQHSFLCIYIERQVKSAGFEIKIYSYCRRLDKKIHVTAGMNKTYRNDPEVKQEVNVDVTMCHTM